MTEREKPPNIRYLMHKKHCDNCEYSQHAPIIGSWCEKYKGYPVSSNYVCDDWKKIKTKKKIYSVGPCPPQLIDQLMKEKFNGKQKSKR